MIKRIRRGAAMLLFLWMLVIPVFAARELVPVGRVVGIEMESDRVCVAAIDDFMGISAKKAGLMPGDELLEMDGRPVRTAEDVKKILQRSDGTVILKVLRGGRVHELKLHPEATARGPQLGIYLRQGISGIGTVTWYDPETGAFGALGHGVNSRQGSLLKMTAGPPARASPAGIRHLRLPAGPEGEKLPPGHGGCDGHCSRAGGHGKRTGRFASLCQPLQPFLPIRQPAHRLRDLPAPRPRKAPVRSIKPPLPVRTGVALFISLPSSRKGR